MKMSFIFLMLLFASIGQAQTDTPTPTSTPHNSALGFGMYQFEDLSSPQIELTGTWSIEVNGTTESLISSENGATLTFHVDTTADYLLIYRSVTDTNFGAWSLCIDAMPCLSISDSGTDGIEPVAIELSDTNSQIVITKTDGNVSKFDFMTISVGESAFIQTPTAVSSPVVIFVPIIATPITTPTPNHVDYIETSEGANVRLDNTVTTGDRFQAVVGVMTLFVLLVLLVVTLWKK